jgi:hypothetical protein
VQGCGGVFGIWGFKFFGMGRKGVSQMGDLLVWCFNARMIHDEAQEKDEEEARW